MIFDGIGLFILIHKFDGNLKDTIVGWCTRGKSKVKYLVCIAICLNVENQDYYLSNTF